MWEKVVQSGRWWSAGEVRRFGFKGKVERMFLNHYHHNLDEKGRLTIPVRYRELISEGAYVTLGFDQNLMVLTTSYFNEIAERSAKLSLTDPTSRQLMRLIFSNAERVEVDKAGRILIPQSLREAVQLDGEAVVVGVLNYFEIWSPSLWNRQSDSMTNADANDQRFSALTL